MRVRPALLLALGMLGVPARAGAQEDEGETFSIVDPDNVDVAAAGAPAPPPATFQSTLFRGAWRVQLAADTAHEDRCDDRACEDVFELFNRLDLRLQTDVSESLRALVEVRFDHFVVGEKPEDQTFLLYNAERVKGHLEAEPREAWVRYKHGPLRLTVGNQVVAWGVLDMGSAQDVVNPVDYRQGFAPGTEPPRIPVLAARAVTRLGPVSLDGVLVPFFEPHRMNLFGRDFSMLGSISAGGVGPLSSPVFAMMLSNIDESREDDYQSLLQASQPPMDEPQSASAGLRLGTSLAGVDLHAAYLYGWDRLPWIEQEPGALLPTMSYRRQHIVGGDATAAISDFVVRAEAGWSPERTLFSGEMTPVRKPTVLSGLAVDYTGDTDLTASLEGFWFHVLDLKAGEELYMLDVDVYGVAGVVRATWLDEELTTGLFGMYLASKGDVILSPEVTWSPADGHELGIAVQIYEGPDESIGGLFDHNDQVVVHYTASF